MAKILEYGPRYLDKRSGQSMIADEVPGSPCDHRRWTR